MLRRVLILFLILSSEACASKMPASYTPQTKQLYVLTDMVNAIGALGLAAENAVPANIIPLPSARVIVQFCLGANTWIGEFPNGWYKAVFASYQQLKTSLPASVKDNFQYAFDAFETILYTFTPPPEAKQ